MPILETCDDTDVVASGDQSLARLAQRLCLALFALLLIFSMSMLDVHGDEGYYYNTVDLMLRGFVPYRDFLTTQTPFAYYPFVPIFWLTGGSYVSVRIFASLLSFAAVWIIIATTRRRFGESAAAVVGILMACNIATVYTTSLFKSYCLINFISALVYWVLMSDRSDRFKYPLAAALIALLPAARLSLVAAPVFFLIGLTIVYYRDLRLVATSYLAGIATTLVILAPSLRHFHDFYVSVIEFHFFAAELHKTEIGYNWHKGLMNTLTYYGQALQDHPLTFALIVTAIIAGTWELKRLERPLRETLSRHWLIVVVVATVGFTHFLHMSKSIKFSEYDEVLVVPLSIVLGLYVVYRLLPQFKTKAMPQILILLLAINMASGVNSIASLLIMEKGRIGVASRIKQFSVVDEWMPKDAIAYVFPFDFTMLTGRHSLPISTMGPFNYCTNNSVTLDELQKHAYYSPELLLDLMRAQTCEYFVLGPLPAMFPNLTPEDAHMMEQLYEPLGTFGGIDNSPITVYRRRSPQP